LKTQGLLSSKMDEPKKIDAAKPVEHSARSQNLLLTIHHLADQFQRTMLRLSLLASLYRELGLCVKQAANSSTAGADVYAVCAR
jgi:hypothetical protein